MKRLWKQEIQEKQIVFLSFHDQFSAKETSSTDPSRLGLCKQDTDILPFSVAEFIREEDTDRHWQLCAVPFLQCEPVLIPLPSEVCAVLPYASSQGCELDCSLQDCVTGSNLSHCEALSYLKQRISTSEMNHISKTQGKAERNSGFTPVMYWGTAILMYTLLSLFQTT